MVFYRPITDRTAIASYFPDAVLPQDKIIGAYIAEENARNCGKCLVTVDGYTCEISHLSVEDGDALLTEGLLRAALNFAGNRNAYIAICRETAYRDVLRLLGFYEKEDVFTGEIPTLLLGSCCKGGCANPKL